MKILKFEEVNMIKLNCFFFFYVGIGNEMTFYISFFKGALADFAQRGNGLMGNVLQYSGGWDGYHSA